MKLARRPGTKGRLTGLLDCCVVESGPFRGSLLVPGCGLGHDVRALSTLENQVIGLDIALGRHREGADVSKNRQRGIYRGGLIQSLRTSVPRFDWTFEHTCFCAIEPSMRRTYAAAVTRALKPGGRLFAIFYLNPAVDRQPPYGVTEFELDQLFSSFILTRQGSRSAHSQTANRAN